VKVDAQGLDYETLLNIQKAHLAIWSLRIVPAMFAQVKEFVLSQNQEARESQPKHRVYRGQDLIEIIRQWPDLDAVYKPTLEPETKVSPSDLI